MPRSKHTPQDKLAILNGVFKTNLSMEAYYQKHHISRNTFKHWQTLYERDGIDGLTESNHWTRYSTETKLAAVTAYLNDEGGLATISQRFGLRSTKQLADWVKKYQYNGTNKLAATPVRKVLTMTHKTTFEERMTIVEYALAHQRNYNATAEHFQVSYQQVRNWVLKSDKGGFEALKDRRGRTKPEAEMTEIERLRLENRRLKAEVKENELAVKFAKKLEEIRNREG